MLNHVGGRRTRLSARIVLPALLAGLVFTGSAGATSVAPLSLVELIDNAETNVAGEVLAVVDGFDGRGLPYTEVTLRVQDAIRGAKGNTCTFRQFGLDQPRRLPDGRIYLARPTGWPTWRRGESAIVFLYSKAPTTGLQTTVGLGQGKLSVANGRAMNAYDNATLFRDVRIDRSHLTDADRKLLGTRAGPVDANALRGLLHRAVEGRWTRTGVMTNAKE